MGRMKELRIRILGLENQVRRILDDRASLWHRLEIAFNTYVLTRHTSSSKSAMIAGESVLQNLAIRACTNAKVYAPDIVEFAYYSLLSCHSGPH